MVTGNNKFFTLSPQRASELGLRPSDLLRLSAPGSHHLRELALTAPALAKLGREGSATWLFRPPGEPAHASRDVPAPRLFTTAWHRDSISPDTDTAYGQLLRRMPVTDDPNTRYGLAAPDEALRAALRVKSRAETAAAHRHLRPLLGRPRPRNQCSSQPPPRARRSRHAHDVPARRCCPVSTTALPRLLANRVASPASGASAP